ncbi:MAG: elongation factor P-like protein YeiP [Pseudomonadales bacterium]|uniref:Elongation factor P-like protein n=1 Tax=Oleiphilus messinensis TaxID=141451 RepID=A0A1Y0IEC8_9GAMM|nr:elongation factor P-like protein YeiP [Oleiphilus messinensis]ARU57825.1 elongation factor P-like protein [Oleiphilus messinensis]MCG8612874.1 elongation factor P-like protein YeiP [Pseudomonadales bacterium]
MPKANELKRGMVVDIDGVPYIVKNVEVKSPSSRGAATLYKIRFNNLQTKQKRDESLKGEDFFKEADCARVSVQYSYLDGDTFYFMNQEDYSQYGLNRDDIGDDVAFLVDGLEGITALLLDGNLIGIELPASVVMTVVDTAPGIKGASASARTKPATLTTGFEVQVPEYLEPGEEIRINTSTRKFMSRA